MGLRIDRQTVGPAHFTRTPGDFGQRQRTIQRKCDIFSRRQGIEKRKMLENHANAELSCRSRFMDGNTLPLPDNLAFKRLQGAKQHFDESGFARAVFTQKRMDFTLGNGEIDPIASSELTKNFREPADIQKRPVG